MLMAPLESPLTRIEDDLTREALELFIMVTFLKPTDAAHTQLRFTTESLVST